MANTANVTTAQDVRNHLAAKLDLLRASQTKMRTINAAALAAVAGIEVAFLDRIVRELDTLAGSQGSK